MSLLFSHKIHVVEIKSKLGMTPHPLLQKIVRHFYINRQRIVNYTDFLTYMIDEGATEDEAYTLMWEFNNVWENYDGNIGPNNT